MIVLHSAHWAEAEKEAVQAIQYLKSVNFALTKTLMCHESFLSFVPIKLM